MGFIADDFDFIAKRAKDLRDEAIQADLNRLERTIISQNPSLYTIRVCSGPSLDSWGNVLNCKRLPSENDESYRVRIVNDLKGRV
jgi:hypothetical protein